jgi:hypothetical protein
MTFAQRKLAVFAAWALTVAMLGVTLAIDKPDLWFLIASLMIIPVLIGNRLWVAPEPTLSELIARSRARS